VSDVSRGCELIRKVGSQFRKYRREVIGKGSEETLCPSPVEVWGSAPQIFETDVSANAVWGIRMCLCQRLKFIFVRNTMTLLGKRSFITAAAVNVELICSRQ